MCLEILTQGRSPLLSVKISLFDVFKQLLTLHKLTPTSDATSQRFKHNFTPDMLFHLESLEKKQIVNMRETKLDHRNYHDFDK